MSFNESGVDISSLWLRLLYNCHWFKSQSGYLMGYVILLFYFICTLRTSLIWANVLIPYGIMHACLMQLKDI